MRSAGFQHGAFLWEPRTTPCRRPALQREADEHSVIIAVSKIFSVNHFSPIMKLLSLALTLGILAVTAPSPRAADPFDQSAVPLEVDATDPALAKIVLLAGTPSNKSGQHEYFAGCALLLKWLKATPGVWPVLARDGWPKNEKIFANAKAVVYFGDGGGKQPFIDPARWEVIEKLVNAGAGFVLLHQAVDFPQGPDKQIKEWLGGVWFRDIGARGHWDMEFKDFPEHAITRGVKPFSAPGDGWLYNLHFADKGFVPLVTGQVPDKSRSTPDTKKHNGRAEVIGWAFERPDGGRGFGFTGADLHKNWGAEGQRRVVVNGILWSAKVAVPEGGAKVEMDAAELNQFLDKKSNAAAGTPKPAEKKAVKAKE